jgi:hypothetical protein
MSNVSQSYFTEIIVVDKGENQVAIITDSVDVAASLRRVAFAGEKRAQLRPQRRVGTFTAATGVEQQKMAYSSTDIANPLSYARVNGFLVFNQDGVISQDAACTNVIPFPNWIEEASLALRLRRNDNTKGFAKSAWYARVITAGFLVEIRISGPALDINLADDAAAVQLNDRLENHRVISFTDEYVIIGSNPADGQSTDTLLTFDEYPFQYFDQFVDVDVISNTDYIFIIEAGTTYFDDSYAVDSIAYMNKSVHVTVEIVGITSKSFSLPPSRTLDDGLLSVEFNSGLSQRIRIWFHIYGKAAKLRIKDLRLCKKQGPIEAICDSGSTNLIANSSFTEGVLGWLGYISTEDNFIDGGTYIDLLPPTNPLYWSPSDKAIVLSRDGVQCIRQKVTGININATLYLSFVVVKYDPDIPEATIEYGAIYRSPSTLLVKSERPMNARLAIASPQDGALEIYVRLGANGDKVLIKDILLCSTPAVPSDAKIITPVNPNNFTQPVINCGLDFKTLSFNPAAAAGITDWAGIVYNKALISYPFPPDGVLSRTYEKLNPNDIFNLSLQVMDVGKVIITFILDGRRTLLEFNTKNIGFTDNLNLINTDGSVNAERAGVISGACRVPKSGTVQVNINAILDSHGVTFIPPSLVANKFEKVINGLFLSDVSGWYGGPSETNAWSDPYPPELWVPSILSNGIKHGGLYLFNPVPPGGRAVFGGSVFANQTLRDLLGSTFYMLTFRVDAPDVNAIGRIYVKVIDHNYSAYPLYENSVPDPAYQCRDNQYEVPISSSNSTVYGGLLFGPINSSAVATVQFRSEITVELKDKPFGVVLSEISVLPVTIQDEITGYDGTVYDLTDFDPLSDYYPFRVRWIRACTYSSQQEKALCGEGYELIASDTLKVDAGGWVLRDRLANKEIKGYLDVTKGQISIDRDQVLTKLYTNLVAGRKFKLAFDSIDPKPYKLTIKNDREVLAEGVSDSTIGRHEFTVDVPAQGYAVASLEQAAEAQYVSASGMVKKKKVESVKVTGGSSAKVKYITEITYDNYDVNKIQKITIDNTLDWSKMGLLHNDVYGRPVFTAPRLITLDVEIEQAGPTRFIPITLRRLSANTYWDETYAEQNQITLRNDSILTSNGIIEIYVIRILGYLNAVPLNNACIPDGKVGFKCVPSLNKEGTTNLIDKNPEIRDAIDTTRSGNSYYFYNVPPKLPFTGELVNGSVTVRVTKTVETSTFNAYDPRPEVIFKDDLVTTFSNISMVGLSPPTLDTKSRIANITACMSKENIATDTIPLNGLTVSMVWNGTPRKPVNLFNQFIRIKLREKTYPYKRTILNILPTNDGHSSKAIDKTCSFWKQNGLNNAAEINLLAKGLIMIESIKSGDLTNVENINNYLWAIPTASSLSDKDILSVLYDLPDAPQVIESISIMSLLNIVNNTGDAIPVISNNCSPDPAADLTLSISYTRADKSRAFNSVIRNSDIYNQFEDLTIMPFWDTNNTLGGGVKGKVAQWIETVFELDRLDGKGLDQLTPPVYLNFSGRSRRSNTPM